MRRRRCLVAADGFYEWRAGGPKKQPYFIHFRDDRPFAFAGLWEAWEGPAACGTRNLYPLTTEANAAAVADRRPDAGDPAARGDESWLDPEVEGLRRRLLPLLALPAAERPAGRLRG